MDTTLNPITISETLVPDRERFEFLPKMFPGCYLVAESTVNAIFRQLTESTDPVNWDFYTLSNNGYYMAPSVTHGKFHRFVARGHSFTNVMSCRAIGVTTSLFALGAMVTKTDSAQLLDHYFALYDYVPFLEESDLIQATIN